MEANDFKLWIVQRLSGIEKLKGDDISIAIYAVAILEKMRTDSNLRQYCVSHLTEFLGKNTEGFVDDLLEVHASFDTRQDEGNGRIQSSIEAIQRSPRRSPVRQKRRRPFCPPRRDRSSSTGSGSSAEVRRSPRGVEDTQRPSTFFTRRDRPPRPARRHAGVDPSVLSAMKKAFDTSARGDKPRRGPPPNSVLITHMPPHNNTISFLNEHYGEFGRIENIQVNFDSRPDSALISFATAEDAENALRSSNSVFSDSSVRVSLLSTSSRRRPVFPPRSKLSLNNVARRKTDIVVAKLAQKNPEDDTFHKLTQVHELKSNLLSTVENQLKCLPSPADIPNQKDREEILQMRDTMTQQRNALLADIEEIDKKLAGLRPSLPGVESMSPLRMRALLLSLELSLLSPKCPSRIDVLRRRQRILRKLGIQDNSFHSTVPKLISRLQHTSINPRFEVDKRCRTLCIQLNIPIDSCQLCDILKERLYADAVVSGEVISATYSSRSKAEKVLTIINSFTGRPLSVGWADEDVGNRD